MGGVFCAVMETTDKVIEERRLRLLNALAEAARAPTPAEACARAAVDIGRSPNDVPFALLYLFDESGTAALAGRANIDPGSPLAPAIVRPGEQAPWPLESLTEDPIAVPLVSGPADARGAVLFPIEQSGGGRRFGFVVAGLSQMLGRARPIRDFTSCWPGVSRRRSAAPPPMKTSVDEPKHRRARRAKTAFFSNVSHEFRNAAHPDAGTARGRPGGDRRDR